MFAQLLISFSLFALAGFVTYIFLSGFIWGAGFQPSSLKEVDQIIPILNLHSDSVVLDLGSGSGAVVIRFAEKCGAICQGFEIDPIKVWWSRVRIAKRGLSKKIQIRRENLMSADVSKADVVYLFLSNNTKIMKQLETKLAKEMKPSAKIVSYVHRFKDWTPERRSGEMFIYSPLM
jgi:tRNA A58 N-methylase Trm61